MRRSAKSLGALAVVGVALALAVVVALSAVDPRNRRADVDLYSSYADRLLDGAVPYRDFDLEYPPLAVPVFVLPAAAGDGYALAFEVAMALLAGVVALAAWLLLRRLGRDDWPPLLAVPAVVCLLPVALDRYDFWPAALVSLWLVAQLAERPRLAAALLGAAVVAKLYPLALAPLGAAWVYRRRGRRAALVWAAVLAATIAAFVVPFVAVAPEGVERSLVRQLERPLHIESSGASLLLVADELVDVPFGLQGSHGSLNATGETAEAVATVTTAVQLVLLVLVWFLFARVRDPGPELLVTAAATVLAVLVATGKVLSPQFVVWLLPAAALVRGATRWTLALLVLAAGLTTVVFPVWYGALADGRLHAVAALAARNAALLALAVVLLLALRSQARGGG